MTLRCAAPRGSRRRQSLYEYQPSIKAWGRQRCAGTYRRSRCRSRTALIVGIEDRCDRLGRDYVSGREYNRMRCAAVTSTGIEQSLDTLPRSPEKRNGPA